MKVESVKLDERGRKIHTTKKLRGRKIDRKTRELKRFGRKKLENLSKSDKHYDHGVFKNARVIGKPKDNYTETYEHDIHGSKVRYPYDSRCHPAHTDRE